MDCFANGFWNPRLACLVALCGTNCVTGAECGPDTVLQGTQCVLAGSGTSGDADVDTDSDGDADADGDSDTDAGGESGTDTDTNGESGEVVYEVCASGAPFVDVQSAVDA